MSTSGVKTYSTSTRNIIEKAFTNSGIHRIVSSIPNEDYEFARDTLNSLVKSWQSMGFNIWNDRRAALFLQYNQSSYNLGGTNAWHATESYVKTTLSLDEIAGSKIIEVDDTDGILKDDYIGIVLNDSTMFWDTVAGIGLVTTHNEPFTSDSGFTYDSAKTEFVAGQIQQKSQTPANAQCWATYTSSINLSASVNNGVLTGNGTGNPTVSGGYLDLSGGTLKYVDYAGANNIDNIIQIGAIKFIVKPDYSGSPASSQFFIAISKASSDAVNEISLLHNISGNIQLTIKDSTGANIIAAVSLGAWNPTSGTDYEFELNFNITSGATRLFIDGVQFGAGSAATGSRSSDIGLLRTGTGVTPGAFSDFKIKDLVCFNTIQHTSNYTPGYTLPENIYIEDLVTLPSFSGNITEYISFSTTETSNVRYTINNRYWNGSAWAASDNSYAQMNSASDINTNISSLTPLDTTVIKMRMETSNIQSKVDDLNLVYADDTIPTIRIALSTGLPSAADSGKTVFAYTAKITKPLEVTQVMLKQNSTNEIILTRMPRERYFNLSDKSSLGIPNQFYYFRRRTDGILFVWSTPSDVSQVIDFTYQPYLDDFVNQADEPDYPVEWERALIWNLASELCCPFGVGTELFNKVTSKATYWLQLAKSNDNENSSLTFGKNKYN